MRNYCGHNQQRPEGGFTLVEVIIALAIIGLLLIVVVAGATPTIRAQRFGDKVREFTNVIKQAQTKSYAGQVGAAGNSCATPSQVGPAACFWRGNLLDFDTTVSPAAYNLSLLFGSDLSSVSGNYLQQSGIFGQQAYQSNAASGLSLQILYDPAQCSSSGGAPNFSGSATKISLGFLAPDGALFTSIPNTFANPSPANSNAFGQRCPVQFKLTDTSVPNLTGIVTVNPYSGNISSTVQ